MEISIGEEGFHTSGTAFSLAVLKQAQSQTVTIFGHDVAGQTSAFSGCSCKANQSVYLVSQAN